MKIRIPRLSATLALPLVLAAGVALPHGSSPGDREQAGWTHVHDWEDEGHSYDRARRASEAGEILPIAAIYEQALRAQPGRVLEAELERARGRWIYELKILDPEGRLYELKLDAASGEILKREEGD